MSHPIADKREISKESSGTRTHFQTLDLRAGYFAISVGHQKVTREKLTCTKLARDDVGGPNTTKIKRNSTNSHCNCDSNNPKDQSLD